MKEEEVIEMLNALKNNWTIDFNKLKALCDYCTSAINQLQAYKAKEKELREFILKSQNTRIINGYGSGIRELDMKLKTLLEDSILDILDKEN